MTNRRDLIIEIPNQILIYDLEKPLECQVLNNCAKLTAGLMFVQNTSTIVRLESVEDWLATNYDSL